ncbi:MAG: TauD/TfdA family dioxygenase [Bradyrhizobium sp.]
MSTPWKRRSTRSKQKTFAPAPPRSTGSTPACARANRTRRRDACRRRLRRGCPCGGPRKGDVVMWDNRATMHRGRPWPAPEPRLMIRTTISATEADGVGSMRPPSSQAAN